MSHIGQGMSCSNSFNYPVTLYAQTIFNQNVKPKRFYWVLRSTVVLNTSFHLTSRPLSFLSTMFLVLSGPLCPWLFRKALFPFLRLTWALQGLALTGALLCTLPPWAHMPPGLELWSASGGLPNPHLRLTYHLHPVSCLHAHPGCFSAQQSIPSYPTVTWNLALPKVSSLSLHPTLASFPAVCSPSTNMFCFWINVQAILLGPHSIRTGKNLICPLSFTATLEPINLTIPFLCFLDSKNGGRDK